MKLAIHFRFVAVLLILPLITCISSTKRSVHAVSRGDRAFARGDFKQALAEYSEATHLDRLNGKAYLGVGRAYIRLGKTAQAEPALVRAIDTLHGWPSISECYVELANTYIALHGNTRSYLEASGSMASQLLEHDAKSFDGHRIWAEVARLQGSLETLPAEAARWRSKALQEFAIANQIRPDQLGVLFPWALTLRANGDLENAKAMYLRLLKLQPNSIPVLGALYNLELERQKPEDAEDYLQRCLSLNSGDRTALFRIVGDAIASGRNDDARKILKVLAERNQDPDRVSTLFFKAGFPDQGLKALQQAITRNPSQARHYFEETTQKLAILGKDQLAARTAVACLARFRDDIPCRAVKLFEDYQSASKSPDLAALQVLAARYSTNPFIRLYLGRISQRKGSVDDARIQYNLGLSADPNNLDLRLALANLEISSGAPEAARADAQYLLREDPQNRAALEILNRTAPKIQPQ